MKLHSLLSRIDEDQAFITKLTNHILKTGMFVDHGSGLDEFIDGFEGEPWWDTSLPNDQIIKTPEFQNGFREWMPHRYNYAMKYLKQDMGGGFPFEINRAMNVPYNWNPQQTGVGKYWSTLDNPESWGNAQFNKKEKVDIVLTGICTKQNINWKETVKSRMDFANGDYEQEIQLVPGTTIEITNSTGMDIPLGMYKV